MLSLLNLYAIVACFFLTFAPTYAATTSRGAAPASPPSVAATTRSSSASSVRSSVSVSPSSSAGSGTSGGSPSNTDSASSSSSSVVPDVLLRVPNLSVKKIELDVDNLKADLNLNAQVASLVTINAGVAVSIEKVNITISDVKAQLELQVRLGHLVDIVNRVFESLDLNPLLIEALNDVTQVVNTVVGAVDGLLGSITQGGTTLNFLIDNLGNIVQQVAGTAGNLVSSIVGDYATNMTFTGQQQSVGNGLTQKTYSYGPLNALVNIVFNTLGQVVQATVAKPNGQGGSSSSAGGASSTKPASSSTVAATLSATPSAAPSSTATSS